MKDRLCVVCRALVASLTLATVSLTAPFAAQAAEKADKAEEIDVAGAYACRGSNPGGGTYSGKVLITKTGQTYKIQWTIGSAQAHVGIGIREGNVLSVCFVAAEGVGVVAYKIQKDENGPRLTGRWAGLGGQKTQSETLTRGSPVPRKGVQSPSRFTQSSPRPRAKTT